MRLKTFQGDSLPDVVDEIRAAFGVNAIIVSTSGDELGVAVTAAIPKSDARSILRSDSLHEHNETSGLSIFLESVRSINKTCACHGIQKDLQEKWIEGITFDKHNDVCDSASVKNSVEDQMVQALGSVFSFDPSWIDRLTPQCPFIIMGTPGSGKTLMLAKLASMLLAAHKSVRFISLDSKKAGDVAQIEAYAAEMNISAHFTHSEEMEKEKGESIGKEEIWLIDTPGINPLLASDREYILRICALFSDVFLSLVFPAGMDFQEMRGMMTALEPLSLSALMISRVDCSLRLGSLLNACVGSNVILGGFANSSSVGGPITVLSPRTLTDQLLSMQKSQEE